MRIKAAITANTEGVGQSGLLESTLSHHLAHMQGPSGGGGVGEGTVSLILDVQHSDILSYR